MQSHRLTIRPILSKNSKHNSVLLYVHYCHNWSTMQLNFTKTSQFTMPELTVHSRQEDTTNCIYYTPYYYYYTVGWAAGRASGL